MYYQNRRRNAHGNQIHVTGTNRKELVNVISKATGMKAVYKFMPTCNFEIGCFTVNKEGTLLIDAQADHGEVARVLEAIAAAGFEGEAQDTEAVLAEEEALSSMEDTAETAEPMEKDATEEADSNEAEAANITEDAETTEAEEASISEAASERLGLRWRSAGEGGGGQSHQAAGCQGRSHQEGTGNQRAAHRSSGRPGGIPLVFRTSGCDAVQAYTHFILALCEMSKNAKRVTVTEKAVDNEKYAFRCFLLRLGFIGARV